MSRTHRGALLATGLALVSGAVAPLRAAEQAESIYEASGVRGGLVVHLGCGQGELTVDLRVSNGIIVQGLDADQKNVEAARRLIQSSGLYGSVSVRHWDRTYLPYGDNVVNLIVVSDGAKGVAHNEIARVLSPRGVYISDPKSKIQNPKWTKPIPDDIDDWTHYLHDAGNNAVAEDDRVGPPRHLQWKSGPMWSRSHEFASSVHAMVSADGRMFSIFDEGIIGQPRGVPALWTLIAQDAFNGILLWRLACEQVNPHALAAVGGRVYVTLKRRAPLTILDAATGKTLHTCEETGRVEEFAVLEGRVVLYTQLRDTNGKTKTHVAAADARDGHLQWKTAANTIVKNTLVAGKGRVCYSNGKELVCLSLENGKEQWRASANSSKRGYAVLYGDTVFLTGGSTKAFALNTGRLLWTGPDGNPHARNPPGLFGANGLIWRAWDHVEPRSFLWQHREEVRNGYDALTGEVKKTVRAERLVTAGHHIRCYPPKATRRYLLLNKRGVEFFDLEGDNHMRANWTRGACGFGVLPANGFLYTPPAQCFCYPGVLLSGFNALAAARERPGHEQRPRLEKGPAFDEIGRYKSPITDPLDWPTYRKDARRSGSINATLPSDLGRVWETSLCAPAFPPLVENDDAGKENGPILPAATATAEPPKLRDRPHGGLTPPVAAVGKVFVAEPDAHSVHAIDAANGKRAWTFIADGRVDSPPTIHRGLCLFGSTDGHVYCLSAATGTLAWRFRAAPEERQICVMGQVESAWPVHGSVLVRDDKVYFTAGRSSYLDGGIHVYALDPGTGEMIHETLLRTEEPDVSKDGGRPFDMEGVRSDILIAGKEDIYMFQERLNGDLTRQPMDRVTKLGDRMGEPRMMTTDGFLDKTWFNRTYWMHSERWPGYYFTYRGPKSGQILVFDDDKTYALKVYTQRHGHSPEFQPGTGYRLIADRNTTRHVLDVMDIGAEKGRGYSRTELPIWEEKIPIRTHGMVLARERLYLAGAPDLLPEQGAYDAMIGKKGAIFRVVDTDDGKTVTEFKMKEVPVFDGLIAAGDRLYMTTMDGTLICFGGKQ